MHQRICTVRGFSGGSFIPPFNLPDTLSLSARLETKLLEKHLSANVCQSMTKSLIAHFNPFQSVIDCYRLKRSITVDHRLQQSMTVWDSLQQCITVCSILQQPATACDSL